MTRLHCTCVAHRNARSHGGNEAPRILSGYFYTAKSTNPVTSLNLRSREQDLRTGYLDQEVVGLDVWLEYVDPFTHN